MKIINIHRNSKYETRFHRKMGCLITRVTYIRKAFLSIPYKTIHRYRETYYGKVKDCDQCETALIY